jgi:plasmid stabilization system protein ParE
VRELNDPTIRELLVFKYRLLYEVEDHRILIVAFLHGARDFATWWQTQQQE